MGGGGGYSVGMGAQVDIIVHAFFLLQFKKKLFLNFKKELSSEIEDTAKVLLINDCKGPFNFVT